MDKERFTICKSIGGRLAVYIRNKGDSLPTTAEMLAVSADLAGSNEELLIPLKTLVAQKEFRALLEYAGSGSGLIQRKALLDSLSISLSNRAIEDLSVIIDGFLDLGSPDRLNTRSNQVNAAKVPFATAEKGTRSQPNHSISTQHSPKTKLQLLTALAAITGASFSLIALMNRERICEGINLFFCSSSKPSDNIVKQEKSMKRVNEISKISTRQINSSPIIIPGRCHMDICFEQSITKVSVLKQTKDETLYEISIGTRDWPAADPRPSTETLPFIKDNRETFILCSKSRPAYIVKLPQENSNSYYYHANLLNPDGQSSYGYNESNYPLYWATCHGLLRPDYFSKQMIEKATELGYPGNLLEDYTEINSPLDIMR